MKLFRLVYLLYFARGSFSLPEEKRIDCLIGKDEPTCRSAGCDWEYTDTAAPSCYLPPNYGYRAVGNLYNVENGKAIDLVLASNVSMFGDDFAEITVLFEHQTDNRLRVKLFPSKVERYEVPVKITGDSVVLDAEYLYEVFNEPVFSAKIIRRSTGTVIFDTSIGGLTLSDQFLQIATFLPSANLYGLGEQEQPSLRHDMNWKTWGMFTRDQAPNGDANLYGVHPHYTVLEEDGNAHGVLFLNSNAQEVALLPSPGLVYRTIGGILDIYLFLGPGPEDVVSQYTEAVGRYYVPPVWALGFHLCRWGYNSLDTMMATWKRTRDAGIPFDVQWADIDYMDRVLDFTVNPTEFAGLPEFVDSLHDVGMKFIPILDPCISMGEPEGTYPPYEEGMKMDVWVKNSSGDPLVGKVWPADNCHFPDFSNPNTQTWWVDQLERLHDNLEYDGIWIDMNEPSNFVAGSVTGCSENKWNYPPYKPKATGDTLFDKTVCLDSEQTFGLHYNTHSLYGWSQSEPTLRGVQRATGKRGLVVSRSTFVGSGKYAAHWLGDNFSEWDNMHASIIGILQFNQFGYPLVGADICGFIGNTTEELCARWHQLGAFYPFTRNHNILDAIDQDPASWPGGLVSRVARDSLAVKYTLMPYIYSLFYQHTLKGRTVVRPVWHEFPRNRATWNIDTQFMLGPAVLVSPILTEGQTAREIYLPEEAVWYSSGVKVPSGTVTVQSDLENESHGTPMHLRGGHIVPTRVPGQVFNNTQEMQDSNQFVLAVLLDQEGKASGELYLDDGESINPDNLHTRISFTAESGVLLSRVDVDEYTDAAENTFAWIQVLGVEEPVHQVSFNNELITEFSYLEDTHQLWVIPPPSHRINQPFIIHWFDL